MTSSFKNVALLLAIFLGVGCGSTTRIYTSPTGANLTLDGSKQLGTSPLEYKETVWIWTKHQVTATIDGHETKTITIRHSGMQGAGFAACACTLGLLLPFMFLSSYPTQYVINLTPDSEPVSEPVAFKSTIDFK